MFAGIALIVVAVGALAVMGFLLLAPRGGDPVATRVEGIRAQSSVSPSTMYTPAGMVVLPSAPNEAQVEAARRARQDQNKQTLRDRLMQAGLYRAYSPATFVIARILLALCGWSRHSSAEFLARPSQERPPEKAETVLARCPRRDCGLFGGGLEPDGSLLESRPGIDGRPSAAGVGIADRTTRGANGTFHGRGSAAIRQAV